MKYILCLVYVFFSVAGLTCIKIGSAENAGICIPLLEITINKLSLIGIMSYGISFILYLGVISKFDLGVIIPIIGGIINIAVLGVSIFILKESLSSNMIIGAITVIIGIIIMNI